MARDRFDRQIRLFGLDGQARLRKACVAVVGVGGLGTHVVQQLALLGVGCLLLVDPEALAETNRNRYVGCWADDTNGTTKIALARRHVNLIDPQIEVDGLHGSFISPEGFDLLRWADYVMGCVDSDRARLVLTEFCAAYSKPYIDAASDVLEDGREYGGRIISAINGKGCPLCFGEIDTEAARRDLLCDAATRDLAAIYGVERQVLGTSGPSVVSVNGVIASLAVTELMVLITGLRPPKHCLTYRGSTGKVTERTTPEVMDCPFCNGVYGSESAADVERYLRNR